MNGRSDRFTVFALRAWLWFVPVAMLVSSVVLSVIAALGERWGLMAVMIVLGVFGLALLVFHVWLMFGFGRSNDGQ